MNDEIVEEIHQIRERLYEETKEMTPEERRAKSHAASCWVQQQIAERRARKAAEKQAGQQKLVGR